MPTLYKQNIEIPSDAAHPNEYPVKETKNQIQGLSISFVTSLKFELLNQPGWNCQIWC